MLEYKQGEPARVPVRLIGPSGAPLVGASPSLITARRADGSNAVVPADSWAEVSAGAFAASGTYELILPSEITNVPGVLYYAVVAQDANHIGIVKIVAAEEEDTWRIVEERLDESISSRIVTFTGGGSTLRPIVTDARAPHGTHLILTFSKPMNMESALKPANYLIEGLAVQSVAEVSPQQVRLVTSQQVPGAYYRLTMRNLLDLDGIPLASH